MALRLLQPLRASQPARQQLLLELRSPLDSSTTARSRSPRSTRCRTRRARTTTSWSAWATARRPAVLIVRAGAQAGDRFALERRHPARPPPRQRDQPRRHHGVAPPRRDRAHRRGLRGHRRRLAQRHLRQPGAHRRAVLHHGDELQIGKFRLVLFERDRWLRPAPAAPVDRRGARAAARGVPRRHDLQDPLPREPGPDRAGADAVGLPQVLRRRRRAAARDPARAARELPAAAGHQGPHRVGRDRAPATRHRHAARRRTPCGRRRRAAEPGARCAEHPARAGRAAPAGAAAADPSASTPSAAAGARLLPGVLVNRDELCAMASVTPDQLAQLEDYGVVTAAAGPATVRRGRRRDRRRRRRFLRAGVDARHLRAGGRRPSGRPGCSSSSSCRCCASATRRPGPGGRAARRARRARRAAAFGDDAAPPCASTSS